MVPAVAQILVLVIAGGLVRRALLPTAALAVIMVVPARFLKVVNAPMDG